jgi:DNA-binding transcriptional regulator/RsmH inhibitor MraZ
MRQKSGLRRIVTFFGSGHKFSLWTRKAWDDEQVYPVHEFGCILSNSQHAVESYAGIWVMTA